MNDHTAFVLAAGFGTRLRPLTERLPKPLVPVCGVPMLSYALALCAAHGHKRVVVNGHYLSEALRPWQGEHEGVHVTLSIEMPDILGTGGGLKRVEGLLAERFAVVNADILRDVDLTALVRAVVEGGAAMALRPTDDVEEYGLVAADSQGVVVQLVDITAAEPVGEVRRDTHFSGVHALHRGALAHVPDAYSSIIRDSYAHTVPVRKVHGLRHEGTWLDVGNPTAYLEANLAVLAGGVALPLEPMSRAGFGRNGLGEHGDSSLVEGARCGGPLWVGPDARVSAGARLRNCVIGARAVVPADAVLENVVVWDDATVPSGTLTNAVVMAADAVVQIPH